MQKTIAAEKSAALPPTAGQPFWTLEHEVVIGELATSKSGLSASEAAARLTKFGPNQLEERVKISPAKIFLNQFRNVLVAILLIAVAISAAVGEILDATAIGAIVILNAIFGFVQEYRAERALEALRKMLVPHAVVIRDGKETRIQAAELVPGDIVVLAAGDQVPADLRLIDATNVQTNEASLTGESTPVIKTTETLKQAELAVGDRHNMAYLGTYIETGAARGVVIATGMKTEMGRIAHLVQEASEVMTPLQVKLQQLGRFLGVMMIAATTVVVVAGVLSGRPLLQMGLVGISLAVAAIPEGLPAVVTIALAIGVQRMARRKAIIRELPAVESLGSATWICTDKTGTLTKNEMTVTKILASEEKEFDVTGIGFAPEGRILLEGRPVDLKSESTLESLLKASALCNEARIEKAEGGWRALGDPTEAALIVAAEKAGISREALEKEYKSVAEFPFTSERKRMSWIFESKGKRYSFAKGGPEVLLECCNQTIKRGKAVRITKADKERIVKSADKLAAQALRVLALAYKPVPKKTKYSEEEAESELIFLGLVGMIDPPRPETLSAIKTCKQAGINISMITGDHKVTAEAIAKSLGLLEEGDLVLTGLELEKMSDNELESVVEKARVYARISPEHKTRIVKALQRRGQIVAVTGDGVNDAPALKKADVGVSMGIIGTDVAKEASDMVLTDDNFATLVAAVEEGRTIFANIKRTVMYLLRGNIGEVLAVFAATLLWPAAPIILLPLQILWINLLTDGLPALGLGVEPAEPDVMQRPPRKEKHAIITKASAIEFVTLGALTAAATLAVFHIEYNVFGDTARAQTAAFATLVTAELLFALDMRSERRPLIRRDFFTNRLLLIAVFGSLALQFAVIYLPPLQAIFNTVALGAQEWAEVSIASGLLILIADLRKRFFVS